MCDITLNLPNGDGYEYGYKTQNFQKIAQLLAFVTLEIGL